SGLNSATLASATWQADGWAAAAAAAEVSGKEAYSSCGGANCCGMTTGKGFDAALVALTRLGCGTEEGTSGAADLSGAAIVGVPLGMTPSAPCALVFCGAARTIVLSTATTTARFTRTSPAQWRPLFRPAAASSSSLSGAPHRHDQGRLPWRARWVTSEQIERAPVSRKIALREHRRRMIFRIDHAQKGRNAMLG